VEAVADLPLHLGDPSGALPHRGVVPRTQPHLRGEVRGALDSRRDEVLEPRGAGVQVGLLEDLRVEIGRRLVEGLPEAAVWAFATAAIRVRARAKMRGLITSS